MERHQSHKLCSILVLVGKGAEQGEERFDKICKAVIEHQWVDGKTVS